MTGYVVGYDAIRTNIPSLPKGAQIYAGYSTGSGDVPWTEADFAAHATVLGPCLRYDQDPAASDPTADVLDVERGAATVADCSWWARKALADFGAWKRPGQRSPAIYCSASNVTAVVNALVSGGIASGVGLILADWSLSEPQAVADVLGAKGPFPVAGVQWADPGPYDVNIYSRAWLLDQAGHPASAPQPAPSPVPAWQEAMMKALPEVRLGDTGEVVRTVQGLCIARGHPIACDGDFGPTTHGAVVAVQQAAHITEDGTVGPATWPALAGV